MKKVFKIISVCGFIMAFNTVSMCDYQTEMGIDVMTEFELYTRLPTACTTLVSGIIDKKVCMHMGKIKVQKSKHRTYARICRE